jgi:hypothetical protein
MPRTRSLEARFTISNSTRLRASRLRLHWCFPYALCASEDRSAYKWEGKRRLYHARRILSAASRVPQVLAIHRENSPRLVVQRSWIAHAGSGHRDVSPELLVSPRNQPHFAGDRLRPISRHDLSVWRNLMLLSPEARFNPTLLSMQAVAPLLQTTPSR